jgi:TonB family protein
VSSAQSEVRSALAAYLEGVTPLPEFEQSVARLLAVRVSSRGVVHSELKAAVADGTLPPESLRRLGLVETLAATEAANPEKAEIPEQDPRPRDNRLRRRNAARGRDIRSKHDEAAQPAIKQRARKAGPVPSESADTDWIDDRRSIPQIPECGALLGNRYRLERVLGEGGMGVVFLAVDQEVRGEVFAIKVLKPEIRANPESLRLLREEVRRTRALRHPHIVGVYSLNSDPSGVYMLMEYLDGKSLKTVLDEEFGRGMPLMRAWPMIYDVGAALAYAHDHNVVHSDIKPSNVIITSSGSCKLLDFGIARADRHRTGTRDATAIGALTPAYACCEMFEGRAPDQSDDVYAFACVIYEMLTGRHPYGRANAVDARAQKLQPAPIKVLTHRQNHALARALEFDRERRTASVEILLEGLKGMANNQRDRRAWIISAAAVATLAVVSTGWLLEHRASRTNSVAAVTPVPVSAAAPEPSPAMPPVVTKAEHGKEAARPGPDATTIKKGKAATAGAVAPIVQDLSAANKPEFAPTASPVSPSKATATPALATTPAVTGSAALAEPNKPTPGAVGAAASSAGGSAALLASSKTTPALVAAEPPATGNGPLLPTSKVIPAAEKAAEPATSGSATPPTASTLLTTPPAASVIPAASIATSESPPSPADSNAPPPVSAGIKGEIDRPPFGKKLPAVIAIADSQTSMQSEENCPYPEEARKEVQTGTVVLLVYVLPDGSAANAQLDGNGSSGSAVLDQAAATCVRELGRFPPKLVGSKAVGYWARTKFVWSFGGL